MTNSPVSGPTGADPRPVADEVDAAAARVGLDCRVTEITEVGTHSVIFGEVVALSLGDRGPALIYLDRAYHRI
jgi:hypothetical protein